MKIYVLNDNKNTNKTFLLIPNQIEKNLNKEAYFLTGVIYKNGKFMLNYVNNDNPYLLIEHWEEITKENAYKHVRVLKNIKIKAEKISQKTYKRYYEANLNEIVIRFLESDIKKYIINLIGEET